MAILSRLLSIPRTKKILLFPRGKFMFGVDKKNCDIVHDALIRNRGSLKVKSVKDSGI
jgi:hypothetical protein